MEILKIKKLIENKGKLDAKITIKEESKTEIKWWIENIKSCSRNLFSREVDITIYTDASNTGWGSTNGVSSTMVDGPLKNKIIILMSWNYWQLSFAFNLSAKIYATKLSALCQITQQPSHMLITWVELNQLDAMTLQERSGTGYQEKEYGLVQIIFRDKKIQRQTKCLAHLQTIPNGCCLMKYLKRSVTYGELQT